MPSYPVPVLLLLCSLLQGQAVAADSVEILRINPFVRPDNVTVTANTAVVADSESMELRGVMLAGEHSLANIGGKIVGIGQDINGYRLITVNERTVVLDRDGTRRELGVRTEDGVGRDE